MRGRTNNTRGQHDDAAPTLFILLTWVRLFATPPSRECSGRFAFAGRGYRWFSICSALVRTDRPVRSPLPVDETIRWRNWSFGRLHSKENVILDNDVMRHEWSENMRLNGNKNLIRKYKSNQININNFMNHPTSFKISKNPKI